MKRSDSNHSSQAVARMQHGQAAAMPRYRWENPTLLARTLLARLARTVGGRVCTFSGRRLSSAEQLLDPLKRRCAEHSAAIEVFLEPGEDEDDDEDEEDEDRVRIFVFLTGVSSLGVRTGQRIHHIKSHQRIP
eukprot:symbB.v1.2.001663.t1/scaffold86.1/size363240/22